MQKKIDEFMRMVEELRRQHGEFVLALSDYENELDYFSLTTDPFKTFEEYKAFSAATEAELDRRGIKYAVHIIRFGEYLNWVNAQGLENTPENRATYVALKSKGAV